MAMTDGPQVEEGNTSPAGSAGTPAAQSSVEKQDSPSVASSGRQEEPADGADRPQVAKVGASPRADDHDNPEDDTTERSVYDNPTLLYLLRHVRSRYRIDDLTNIGPSAFGENATVIGNINLGDGERRKDLFFDPVLDIAARCRTFVPPPYFANLQGRLRRNRIVGLAGPPRSGRMTAACVALSEHRSVDHVRRVSPPNEDVVPYLRRNPEALEKGHCYVIKTTREQMREFFRILEPTFESRDCSAILIRDLASQEEELHRAEFFHEPPAASLEIFRRHLELHLEGRCVADCGACDGGCHGTYISELLTEDVRRSIDLFRSPGECALYAERVARELPRGPAITSVLPSEARRRRERARRILVLAAENDQTYQNRPLQHRRALRIAYAVFAGHTMTSVSEGAGLLLGKLDRLFTEPVIGRPALLNDLPGLLGPDLSADWHERATEDTSSQVPTRVARLDAKLVTAILDVAWNDFDNTRPALIEWVDELASHPAPGFSACAAVAAAIFATHDFDHVYSQLIQRWAHDRRMRVRRTAAAAMVSAANLDGAGELERGTNRPVRTDVTARVEELARSASPLERDTAALVWGMGFVSRHPSQVVRALTVVAANTTYRHSQNVSGAVDSLFGAIGDSWTIGMLAWWLDSDIPALRTQAGQAFLNWLDRLGPAALHDELRALLDGSTHVDHVAALWRTVLLNHRFSLPAWRHFADWLRSGLGEPNLRDPIRLLVRRLAADPAIRSRLDHLLSRATPAAASAA
ncbi:hypothetical protein [Micromonospora costi]|uniref:Uncharacterized protein n=1 Tax=Micromonospora costi TaxID=1530042 RepID=A0A3A9ZWF3_9ACTN|nr:hypothetical protein [Micromonospora costi]RKN52655.1 hypothetical protein D7193_22650 [Micromonospora costi]